MQHRPMLTCDYLLPSRVLSERWRDRSGGIYDPMLSYLSDELRAANFHYEKVERETLKLQAEDRRPLEEAYHPLMLKLISSGASWRPQEDPKGKRLPTSPYHRCIAKRVLRAYLPWHRMRTEHQIFQYHLRDACARMIEPVRSQLQAVVDANGLHAEFMSKAKRISDRQARSIRSWKALRGGLKAKAYCKTWKKRRTGTR